MKKPSSFSSIYDDHTDGASVEYGATLSGHQTVRVAGHVKEDIHQEHNVGEPIRHFNNRTLSAGVEDTLQLSSVITMVAGIGADHQTTIQAQNFVNGVVSDFPLGTTGGINPEAAVHVAVPRGGRLRFEAYRKTRLPAIKDRYSYRMGAAIPNPDLAAERATTAEAGYETPVSRFGSVSATGFYTAVANLVQPVFLQPNLFQLQNVGNVRNSGLEGEWRVRPIRHVEGSFGYSYLHRKNEPGATAPLLNTPSHKLFGYVVYSGVPRLRLIASLNHESSRTSQDDAGVLQSLTGFSSAGAKASYAVRRGLDLEVAAANVFDQNYQLYAGYPEPGRIVSVNLRYRF
jgi:iron complex outermembrane recepter protein